jgi:FKBP12-rapamycin complex-associated protein
MQLFGLVNTLLSVDTNSFKRRLHIQLYPVTPLAPNAGLMGWVQESDTLHVLVRDYRDSRKVLLNIEYRLMLQVFCKIYFVITDPHSQLLDGTRLRESYPPSES